jgi:hypothetical protein
MYKPSSMWEGDVSWSGSLELDYTGPCRPPYLCIELTAQIRKWWDGSIKWKVDGDSDESLRKWWDGSVKWVTESSSIVSPRDPASWLPTGKRQHKPLVIRASVSDQDCDWRDDDCDGVVIIEADTDGDGEREPLSSLNWLPLGQPVLKENKWTWSWSNVWKKEYVGHVTLMK